MKKFLRSISCTMCMDIVTEPQTLECSHSYCAACLSGVPRERKQGNCVICCPLCKNITAEKDIKFNMTMKAMALWYNQNKDADELNTVYLEGLCQKESVTSPEKSPVYLPLTCNTHPNMQVTQFCNTCDEVICPSCHDPDHKEHDTEEMREALASLLPNVKDHLVKLSQNTQEIQSVIARINQQWNEAKSNRKKVKEAVLAERDRKIKRIEQDTKEILDQLESQDTLEVKEITEIKKDLEHTFSCQESLFSWCQALIQVTNGPGLFNELYNELASKIKAFADEPLNLEDEENLDIPQFVFQPSTLGTMNLIGTLDTTDDEECQSDYKHNRGRKISVFNEEIINPIQRRASSFTEQRRSTILAHIRRASLYDQRTSKARITKSKNLYRRTNLHLNLLDSHEIDEVENFKLGKLSQKMCYFDGKLWFPCQEEKDSCIDVYKDGKLESRYTHESIVCPHSLHPISSTQLVVSCDSGLFVINKDLSEVTHVLRGQFLDVGADENYIVALEKVSDKVHQIRVLQNSDTVTARHCFTLPDDNTDTVLLHRNRIFVSSYQEDNIARITKYTVNGEKLVQMGKFGRMKEGELNFPRIGASDINGSVLVADCNNCRLQVVDQDGKWIVIKQAVGYPWDVFITEDSFMYILCGLYQYGYVQKCKIC